MTEVVEHAYLGPGSQLEIGVVTLVSPESDPISPARG